MTEVRKLQEQKGNKVHRNTSFLVIVPKSYARKLGLEKGSLVKFSLNKKSLTLEKYDER